jgi:hypothetical protein
VFNLSEFSTPRGAYNSYCKKCSNFLVAEWKRSKRPIKQLDKIFNNMRNCILDLEEGSRDEAEQHINNLEEKLKQLIIK